MAIQWTMPGPAGPIIVTRGGPGKGRTLSRSDLERWLSNPGCWTNLCEMYEAAGGHIDRHSPTIDFLKPILLSYLQTAFDQGRLTILAVSTGSKPSKAPPSPASSIPTPHMPEVVAAYPSSLPSNRVQPSSFGVTSLSLPWQIAPGAETITMAYTLRDPLHRIEEAILEVWKKGGASPVWVKKLSEKERTDGAHELNWDGKIDTSADFPHGYLTLASSPYRIILRVTGNGTANPERQQAIVEVKFSRIVVELGPRSVLKDEKDLAVYDQIKELPKANVTRLYLKSNLFAIEQAGKSGMDIFHEMYDDTDFKAYRELWGEGPRIPIVATILIKDSRGKEVRAGKALGRSRVLWDYFDPIVRITCRSKVAPAYIDKAVKYECDCSFPKGGGNAHYDFGGKRASQAGIATIFFKEDERIDPKFYCTMNLGDTRWWGAFSEIESNGEDHSQARILFRPSRMAGDRYSLSIYLEVNEGSLDCEENPKSVPKVRIGEFEIWREITLASHLRKCDAITEPIPSVDTYFIDAFMRLENKMGPGRFLTREEYDEAFTYAKSKVDRNVPEIKKLVKKYSIIPGSQYSAGPGKEKIKFVAAIRTYEQFTHAVQMGEGWNDNQLRQALAKPGLGRDTGYYEMANMYIFNIAEEIGSDMAQEEGVTILQFESLHPLEKICRKKGIGRFLGVATLNTRHRTGFVCFEASAETLAHELGHCLFLPHALGPHGGSQPAGAYRRYHDREDQSCMMSYVYDKPGFCGLCLLRLRGWDLNGLNQDGPCI